jgi:hypothetical protein
MKKLVTFLLFAALGASGCAAAMAPKHVVVYHEPGRFGGWPANNGIWSWGNEIVVGFSRAYFQDHPDEHSFDRERPSVTAQARSRDGGETWTVEDHPELQTGEGLTSPGGVNFADPNFALRVRDGVFYVSYDRAHHWLGPWKFTDFGLGRLTARTDYLVNGPKDCTVFLSVKDERVQAGLQDRAFAARTTDGAKTFRFLGWMTGEPLTVRSVMPATVRNADGSLVSILRRRYDLNSGFRNDINWLDAYGSSDEGHTWNFLARIAYTDTSMHNGNSPSQARLPDGRLVAVYGVRSAPFGIRARISADQGRTWGPETILRDDARKWDMGYCRTVVRPDGKVVTVYYYLTRERFENHIEATIWTP